MTFKSLLGAARHFLGCVVNLESAVSNLITATKLHAVVTQYLWYGKCMYIDVQMTVKMEFPMGFSMEMGIRWEKENSFFSVKL